MLFTIVCCNVFSQTKNIHLRLLKLERKTINRVYSGFASSRCLNETNLILKMTFTLYVDNGWFCRSCLQPNASFKTEAEISLL
jgi:hypothetical protein